MNPGDRNDRTRSHGAAPGDDGREAGGRESARSRDGARKSSRRARSQPGAPPETVEEALAQALVHARNALAEALLAGRSLLDAASIGLTGQAANAERQGERSGEAARALVRAAATLDGLSERIRVESADSGHSLVQALLDALDVEIGRWETKARQDQDARAVLRAFLGLRELLWELGMRPTGNPTTATAQAPASAPQARSKMRKRRAPDPSPRTKPSGPDEVESESAPAEAQAAPAPRRKRVQRVEVER